MPQTLVSTGASYWGLQYKQYPWTIGWQPDYIAEGRIYGAHMKANFNGKKIAVLYQNDDYGKDYLYGVRAALGKTYADANIVAEVPFEVTATSLASQMTRIRASGATIFVLLATPTPTIRAYATGKALGFNPEQIYLNSVSATAAFLNIAVGATRAADYVNGSLSVAYLKDPSSPHVEQRRRHEAVPPIMAKYAPSANATTVSTCYGVAKAETFVQALYKAGKNPTRASLMAALLSMNSAEQVRASGRRAEDERRRITSSSARCSSSATRIRTGSSQGRLIDGRPRGR